MNRLVLLSLVLAAVVLAKPMLGPSNASGSSTGLRPGRSPEDGEDAMRLKIINQKTYKKANQPDDQFSYQTQVGKRSTYENKLYGFYIGSLLINLLIVIVLITTCMKLMKMSQFQPERWCHMPPRVAPCKCQPCRKHRKQGRKAPCVDKGDDGGAYVDVQEFDVPGPMCKDMDANPADDPRRWERDTNKDAPSAFLRTLEGISLPKEGPIREGYEGILSHSPSYKDRRFSSKEDKQFEDSTHEHMTDFRREVDRRLQAVHAGYEGELMEFYEDRLPSSQGPLAAAHRLTRSQEDSLIHAPAPKKLHSWQGSPSRNSPRLSDLSSPVEDDSSAEETDCLLQGPVDSFMSFPEDPSDPKTYKSSARTS